MKYPHFDGALIHTGPRNQIAGYVLQVGQWTGDPNGALKGITPDQVQAHNNTLAEADLKATAERGKGLFYLSKQDGNWKVTQWTGAWKARRVIVSIGRHNIARRQYCVTFTGPDGRWWNGRVIGDNTLAMHAKRSKKQ